MSRGIAILLVASLSVLTAEAVLDVLSKVSGCNDGVTSAVTSILDGDEGLLEAVPAGGVISTVVGDVTGESGGGLLGEVEDIVSGVVSTVGSVLGGVTGGSKGGLLGEVGNTVGNGCDVVKPALDSVTGCGGLPVTEVLSSSGTDKVTDAAGVALASGAGSVLSDPRVLKVLLPVIRKLKTNKMTLGTLLKVLAVTGRLK